jgi:hypothetical protein
VRLEQACGLRPQRTWWGFVGGEDRRDEPLPGGGLGGQRFGAEGNAAAVTVGSVITNTEIFEQMHAASGLRPVFSKQHDDGEFRAGIVARELRELSAVAIGYSHRRHEGGRSVYVFFV